MFASLVQTMMIHQSQLNRTEVVHPRMGTEERWKAVAVGERVLFVWTPCWRNWSVDFNALLPGQWRPAPPRCVPYLHV
jgi:hypothetical protein